MMNVSPPKAIIAEDNALVARALGAVLRELGYEVAIVADGEDARQLVFTDPPDLLIADIGLSRVGGSSLIRWMKGMRPDAKVVAISGIGEEGQREVALAAGADAFLAKPFRLSELKQVIGELVQAQ
jgi:CheY-like chemotaxis protein